MNTPSSRWHIIPAVLLILAGCATASAQTDLWCTITDRSGLKDTLYWGLRVDATNGIDRAIGEVEYPPVPPIIIFDTRWIALTAEESFGQGIKTNYRRYASAGQTDTFRFRVQATLEDYPLVLAWGALDGMFRKATLRYSDTKGETRTVDMLKENWFTVQSENPIVTITIITSEPSVAWGMAPDSQHQ